MEGLIAIAQDAPLSTVLVLGGFLFLVLALGGRLKGGLEIPPYRQKWAALIGSVLVCIGVALYFVITAPPDTLRPPVPSVEPTPITPVLTETSESDIYDERFIERAGGLAGGVRGHV